MRANNSLSELNPNQIYWVYTKRDQVIAQANGINSARYFLHNNHLGSVEVETGLNGSVHQASLYQPYGANGKASANTDRVSTYSFSAKEQDGSGLYYFEARYYDPLTTRFISPDLLFATAIEKCIDTRIQCNLYQYSQNNPINWTDLSGLEARATSATDSSGQVYNFNTYNMSGSDSGSAWALIQGRHVTSNGDADAWKQSDNGKPLMDMPLTIAATNVISFGWIEKAVFWVKSTLGFASKNPVVTATAKVKDVSFQDFNQTARVLGSADEPTLILNRVMEKSIKNGKALPNGNMATAHAEVGAIQQAFKAGKTKGEEMTLIVTGKAVCGYCRGDIPVMAENAGLKSLTVVEEATGRIYTWASGMRTLKVQP